MVIFFINTSIVGLKIKNYFTPLTNIILSLIRFVLFYIVMYVIYIYLLGIII